MSEKLPESPEAIAYLLMKDILITESKSIYAPDKRYSSSPQATKQDVLNIYSECLSIVKQPNQK